MDQRDFIEQLTAMAQCPLSMPEFPPQQVLRYRLAEFWNFFFEFRHYTKEAWSWSLETYMMMLPGLDDEGFRTELDRFRTWLEHREDHYYDIVSPVLNMRIIEREERKKHWPYAWMNDKDVDAGSRKSGDGCFYPQATEQLVYGWMCLIMARHLEEFLDQKERYFYMKADRDIGAARGQPTPYVLFDVDCAVRHFHAYPVPLSEIPKEATVDTLEMLGAKIVAPSPPQ